MTAFVDVLSSALLNATQELYPSAAHWDRRAPLLAAHMAENPMIARLFNAAGEVQWEDVSGAAQSLAAGPVAEPCGGSDVPDGTQLPLLFAESSAP